MADTNLMNDLLKLAKADLARLEAAAQEARVAYEKADAAMEEQRGFVLKLEIYATGFSAIGATGENQHKDAAAEAESSPAIVDGLQRKMALTIPRQGTKRYDIGIAAIRAIRIHGPMTTADLLAHIPEGLFDGSSNPRNYLSNALSKDARIDNSARGWTINPSPPSEQAEEVTTNTANS